MIKNNITKTRLGGNPDKQVTGLPMAITNKKITQ